MPTRGAKGQVLPILVSMKVPTPPKSAGIQPLLVASSCFLPRSDASFAPSASDRSE